MWLKFQNGIGTRFEYRKRGSRKSASTSALKMALEMVIEDALMAVSMIFSLAPTSVTRIVLEASGTGSVSRKKFNKNKSIMEH